MSGSAPFTRNLNLLGNGLHHLLRHPDQERRLRSQPAIIGNAVEEFLRFDGPVPATAKVALRDLESLRLRWDADRAR
jgi:cytochrome P450